MADKTLTGIVTWLKNWFYDKTEIDLELSKKKSHYYGTCSTSASTQVKAVTSTDFVLGTGVVLSVKFTNNNTYNGTAKLKINGSEDEINVATVGATTTSRYYWKAGEVVTFLYDGTNFIMAEGGNATTTYYGVTKLSSSTSSTSEALSATPKAVKAAYDLANGKQDALVSGTNIKTINNTSLLGSGDISIGGGSVDVVTSWETSLSDSKVPSEKLVKNSLDGKSDSNHNHNIMDLNQMTAYGVLVLADGVDTYGEGVGLFDNNLIYSNVENRVYYFDDGSDPNQELAVKGDIPSIPSKTSDLTNDGADGTNVYVMNNDSRLSDSRTPTSHTHGQITNGGALTSSAVSVESGDFILITDVSNSNYIRKVSNLLASHIKDSTAHSNIGSVAYDTQEVINSAIDSKIGELKDLIGDAIINISASRPYLLSGEKTDLVVTLHNGVGTPLANKSVTISDGASVYTGITNNQGIFTLLDIGVTDDTTFTATYGTVSATCLVEYCIFVDYAVKDNHNHNYFNQAGTSKVTITEADMYKEFKTISTTAGNVYIGSSTSYTAFDVGNTWTIIYDKLHIEGYNVAFQCYNGSTTVGINSTALLLHNSDFQELKFVCDGSSIKAYVDGVYKTQTSYTSTGHGYLRINLNNNNGASQVTFRAKNIRIK